MKQASKLFLTLTALTLSGPAFADATQAIQSALSRLDAAEQQISSAQAQINAARSDLYSALQNNGPRYLCIFNYMGKQYRAEGATEADRSWSFVPFTKEKGKWKMADNVYPMDDEGEE